MFFTGSTPSGQTVVAELPPGVTVLDVLVDGSATSWEVRDGDRLFITVSGLGLGDHDVNITWFSTSIEEFGSYSDSPGVELFASNPSFEQLTVRGKRFPDFHCSISLFDFSGRMINEQLVQLDSDG